MGFEHPRVHPPYQYHQAHPAISVGTIVREKKYYIESRGKGISYTYVRGLEL